MRLMHSLTKEEAHNRHVNWLEQQYGYSHASAEKEAVRRELLYPQELSRWQDPLT